jgi:hypothetical protein
LLYYLYSYYIVYAKNDKLPDFINWRESFFCRSRNLIQKFSDCAQTLKIMHSHVVIGCRLVLAHCSDSVAVSSVLICDHFFLCLFGDRDSIELAIQIMHTVQTCFCVLHTYLLFTWLLLHAHHCCHLVGDVANKIQGRVNSKEYYQKGGMKLQE